MPKVIARVYGTAITPGISRNGRLYTAEHIAGAVAEAQPRLDAGNLLLTEDDGNAEVAHPLTQRTHHAAEDDSLRVVGRLTELSLAPSGAALFASDIVDTPEGRNILELIDNSDGPAFLRGVSIRGAWTGRVSKQLVDGVLVEVGEGLVLDGLDYTARPGVIGAVVDRVERLDGAAPAEESATGRVLIYETVQEALVTAAVTEEAPAGPAATEAAPAETAPPAPTRWADPSYHDEPRLPLDTRGQAKAAYFALRDPRTTESYTAAQLKRVRERAARGLREHGIEVVRDGILGESFRELPGEVREFFDPWCEPGPPSGAFSVMLDNGTVTVCVHSYTIDPHDLGAVARAAMDGACTTLDGLDPDADGDVDVAGAETAPPAAASATESAPPAPAVQEDAPADPAAPAAAQTSPDGDPAGGPIHGEQEPDVSDTDPAAQTPAATTPAAAPGGIQMTDAQFAQWLATQAPAPAAAAAPAPELATAGAPAEAAPPAAAPVAETTQQMIARMVAEGIAAAQAPAAPAAAAPPVQETQEQMIHRLVQEGIRSGIQTVVESGAGPARKGHVQNGIAESQGTVDGDNLPADWPQKPLHQYTTQEWNQYVRPSTAAHVAGVSVEQLRNAG